MLKIMETQSFFVVLLIHLLPSILTERDAVSENNPNIFLFSKFLTIFIFLNALLRTMLGILLTEAERREGENSDNGNQSSYT